MLQVMTFFVSWRNTKKGSEGIEAVTMIFAEKQSSNHTALNGRLNTRGYRNGIWLLLIILNNNAIIFSYGIGGDLLLL